MGILYVVATPIGNLNDITLRALEILKNVSFIACEDTRQTIKLLNHYEIKKKLVAYHKFNENERSKYIIQKLIEGEDVALVSDAGTPCVSDPGYILVKEARENNIDVYGVPGASASITSLSISGLDTKQFSFIGFLPVDNTKFNQEIEKIKNSKINTFIIYESPKRLVKLIGKLKDIFSMSIIFIASDLTKIHERSFYGEIEEVYNKIKEDPKIERGEYVIILEKKEEEKSLIDTSYSIEAKLVETMKENNCNLKDAIKILNEKDKELKKNDIYNASLNLKNMFEK
ncbi:MAG: 16S rRNA (cytidine(1402)-2'-O)-methyltransferase [Bacilli bacterium]|nr:16S rRNA (cytidine(1402)-2'-O)-methyltransferase [Bacilli bacterium]